MRRFALALARLLAMAALFVGLVGLVGLVGCNANSPSNAGLGYTADAKHAYDAALEEFKAHNWIEAQQLMREVKRKFSYSKYAKLAELRLADADFEQEKFAEAIREYRDFIRAHRSDDDDVAYARSRIAEAQYKEIPDSFLLPATEERDQATALDAYKELRGFLHDYPNAKETDKVRALLTDVTSRLVAHELFVARFYLAKSNYEAAVSRIQYALRNFAGGVEVGGVVVSDSGLEPDALLLLGTVYLQMKRYPEARRAFTIIVQRYPSSILTDQAHNYLSHMKDLGV